MKTLLVQLESHDDLVSIRDKMSWAKTPRILLAWPRSERVDVRPLDLQLLRRHAVSLGAELGLVTHDSEIRAAARGLDLPVFSSAGEAQRKHWPPHRSYARMPRTAPRPDLRARRAALPATELFDAAQRPGTRLAIFAAGVLAVLAVVMVFIPSAEIQISAPERTQRVEIAVSAETTASRVSLSGVIPARQISFQFEESDTILAGGQMVSPDQTAAGQAVFINVTAAKVQVPAGTVVLTRSDPPVRFVTVEAIDIPAGNGSSVQAHLRALAPGSAGNVPAGAIVAFEGPLGLSLSVTNSTAMSGGTDVTAAAPTDADRQALRERLLARMKEHAKTRFAEQLQSGDVAFPSTLAFSKVVTETYTPGPGEPGGKLSLVIRAEFHAHYAAATDLDLLAGRVLDASLPAGYEALDGTLAVEPASALFGSADGNARWHVEATRTLRAHIDPAQVITLVQGRTIWGAGSLLQEMYGLQSAPRITIQPFFWPWLPALPFRINVAG